LHVWYRYWPSLSPIIFGCPPGFLILADNF
jgi:hypothetical protein